MAKLAYEQIWKIQRHNIADKSGSYVLYFHDRGDFREAYKSFSMITLFE